MPADKKRIANGAPAPESISTPPHNLEAEKVVLAGLLMEPDQADEVADILEARDFYLDAHRVIYATIQTLRRTKKGFFDAVLVGERLEAAKRLDEVGGYDYLTELAERTIPHAGLTVAHAELVREKAMLRYAEQTATDLARACRVPGAVPGDVVQEAESKLHEIIERQAGSKKETPDLAGLFLAAMERISSGKTFGAPTGFLKLDDLLSGMHPGNVYVVAARPGAGKTSFAIKLGLNFAARGDAVLFCSLEQPSIDVAERVLSIRSKVPMVNMRRQNVGDADREKILVAAGEITEFPFHIDDTAERTIATLGAAARLHHRRHGIKLLVIDYLQLILPADRRVPREQQVADISRSLKHLSRNLGVPVVVLAQLNRAVEGRTDHRPKLSDLRESGSIEQDADAVLFLFRPWVHDPMGGAAPTDATLLLAKNRNGPTDDIKMHFAPATMDYTEIQEPAPFM